MKSFKHPLKRVVGQTVLTCEEMSTLVAKIEACLNSRPLCSISLHGGETVPLTPGHFLVGEELLSQPEPILDLNLTSTFKSQWVRIRNLRDHFWRHWRLEVLEQLQQRNGWIFPHRNIEIGDLVFVCDDLSPPAAC